MGAGKATDSGARGLTSPITWAFLGLVISRSSYAFELASRLERTYEGALRLSSNSQVYAALDSLEGRGLIEIAPTPGVSRQPKLHYRATTLGVRSYEDWLVEQIDTEHRRQELWVRQLQVFADDPEAALHLIDRFERQYLQEAGDVGRSAQGGAADPRSALIDGLVAEQHRIAVGGMLSWLRSARERFEAIATKPPIA